MTDQSQTTPSDELAANGSKPIGTTAATGHSAGSDGPPPYPYPGLRPFTSSESEIFFGRGAQVAEMLTRLEVHQFLAVVGASGCGKSSLVLAGLLPALEQGFLAAASAQWRFVVMRPGDAPLRNLASELMRALGPHASPDASGIAADEPDPHRVAMVQAALRSGPKGLVQVVEEARLPDDTNVLVLVDQFEELFRFRHRRQPLNGEPPEHSMPAERDEAAALVSLLLATAAQRERPIYVVTTMRSDFLGDCDAFYGLPEAINDSQFLTPRMNREQARDAIVEPARLFGGAVEPALVNRILNEIGDDPDQLPLMQHALMRMWRHAEKYRGQPVTIQLADYEKLGGLKDALSQHADIVMKYLLSDADRRVAEMLFRALCDRSAEQRLTRRLATVAEIAAVAGVQEDAVIRVADAFRRSGRNFLTPPPEVPLTAESTLDISHESLIRQWGTLRRWTQEEAKSAEIFRRLASSAQLHAQGHAELLAGRELEHVLDWRKRERPTSAWASRYLAPTNSGRTEDLFAVCMSFLNESDARWKEHLERQEHKRHEHERLLSERAEAETRRAEAEAAKAREAEARTRAEKARAVEAEGREREQHIAFRRQRTLMWILAGAIVLAGGSAIFNIVQNHRITLANATLKEINGELEEKKDEAERLSNNLRDVLQLTQSKPEFAQTAVDFNTAPKGDDRVEVVGGAIIRPPANGEEPAPRPPKTWSNDTTLEIAFLDGESADHAYIESIAQEWTKYANLRFHFLPFDGSARPNASIRISLSNSNGDWSFVGTDALHIPADRPTMNLQSVRSGSSEGARVTVLREFGHVLGLVNEQMNPNADIPWNKEAVYLYYQTLGWSRSMVDSRVFATLQIPYREFDPKSIMMMPIPAELTRGGFEVDTNTKLSRGDKRYVGDLYPFGPASEIVVDGPAITVSLEKLHLQHFRFEAKASSHYVIQAEGPAGAEVFLYGPGNALDQIAESSAPEDARVTRDLGPGVYYAKIRNLDADGSPSYEVTVKTLPESNDARPAQKR